MHNSFLCHGIYILSDIVLEEQKKGLFSHELLLILKYIIHPQAGLVKMMILSDGNNYECKSCLCLDKVALG